MRYYASLRPLQCQAITALGMYWRHFHILENLDASLGRVFSAIWDEWVMGYVFVIKAHWALN